jgi:hypothetical protein
MTDLAGALAAFDRIAVEGDGIGELSALYRLAEAARGHLAACGDDCDTAVRAHRFLEANADAFAAALARARSAELPSSLTVIHCPDCLVTAANIWSLDIACDRAAAGELCDEHTADVERSCRYANLEHIIRTMPAPDGPLPGTRVETRFVIETRYQGREWILYDAIGTGAIEEEARPLFNAMREGWTGGAEGRLIRRTLVITDEVLDETQPAGGQP